jgi:hypothetical protein
MIGLIAAGIAALAISNLAAVAGLLYLVAEFRKESQDSRKQLQALSEAAMTHLVARSLNEVTDAKAKTAAADLQLGYLADTLAKSAAQKIEAEPKYAKTIDGETIDLSQYENIDI